MREDMYLEQPSSDREMRFGRPMYNKYIASPMEKT